MAISHKYLNEFKYGSEKYLDEYFMNMLSSSFCLFLQAKGRITVMPGKLQV